MSTNRHADWQMQTGASLIYQQTRDETLHKLRNHGPLIAFDAQLNRVTDSNTHGMAFHLPIGVMFDRYGYTAVSIQYGLEGYGLWRIRDGVSFGYRFGANVRYRYFPEWDDAHLYWLTDYTAGPAIQYQFTQDRRFTLYGDIGLLSVVSRSPQYPRNKFDNILTLSGFFSVPQRNFQVRNLGNYQTGKIQLDFDIGDVGSHVFYFETRFVRLPEDLQFVEVGHRLGWRYVF